MDDWILTRRFFLFDTVSGVENNEIQVVRYAKDIKLKFTLDTNNIEQIYVPYVDILYEEKSAEDIRKSSEEYTKEISFMSTYSMDTSDFWTSVRTVFIILIIIFVLMVFMFCILYMRADKLETN